MDMGNTKRGHDTKLVSTSVSLTNYFGFSVEGISCWLLNPHLPGRLDGTTVLGHRGLHFLP